MVDAVMMPSTNRRDRAIVLSAVAATIVVAWIYVAIQAQGMSDMAGEVAMALTDWTAVELILLFVMWSVMMVGMMLPSAVPLILNYAAEVRQTEPQAGVYGLTTVLTLGYVVVWIGFSIVATTAQWALHEAALLSPMMVSTSPVLSGILLLAAGVYQLTPMQYNLLKRCRQPLHFLRRNWRKGTGGAFVMGLEHGAYCLGCCFVLMGILFFGGVMNLLFLAAVTVFVLIEKALPLGNVAGLVSGPLMIAAGIYVLL
jgi:predicted metal-binding membrane protein